MLPMTVRATGQQGLSHDANGDFNYILVILSYQSTCNAPKLNRLTPNDPYMGHTAPLTSKRCILCIYSTNIGTEYFKHALYSPFFIFKMQFVS